MTTPTILAENLRNALMNADPDWLLDSAERAADYLEFLAGFLPPQAEEELAQRYANRK